MNETTRETREIQTPNGHTAIIKTYLIGREIRQVEAIYIQHTKNKVETNKNGKPKIIETNLSEEGSFKVEDKIIEVGLVSLDGSSDDLVTRVVDKIKGEDYNVIKAELMKLINQKKN